MSDLQQAITAIKLGDRVTGKQLLIEAIKANPNNETAWLWMTQVVSTDEERLRCLQNVLKINPNNESAKKGLAVIQQRQVSQPNIEASPKTVEPPPEPTELPPKQPSQTKPVDVSQVKEQVPPPRPLKSLKHENIKKCPYCAETIKAEAKFCRFCGKGLSVEQPPPPPVPQQQPVQQQKKRKSRIPLLLVLIIFTCVGILCISRLIAPSQSNRTPSKPDYSIDARTMCAEFVKERLKSPSTADFIFGTEKVYSVNGKPDNWFVVRGQVDAQNSFGVMMRTNYACQLYYDVNDPETWHLDYIEVE